MLSIYTYKNPYEDRKKIYKDLENKCGIYLWTNVLSNKKYVGSSVNLTGRFKNYFNRAFLVSEITRNNSYIYRALLKHGYSNFRLDILELCNKSNVIEREQFFLNNLELEYNILKVARSLTGFKHSEESKEKIRKSKTGKPFPYSKENLYANKKSICIFVTNLNTGEVLNFPSVRRAALYIGIHYSYLFKCLSKNKCNIRHFILKKKQKGI